METSNPLPQTPNPAQDWDLPPSPPKPFDAGWKLILYNHFYLIVQRISPSLYKTIDTTVPPEFLNTELQKLDPQAIIGHLYPDVLVRVKTKLEQDQLLLCHLEVQTKANKTFDKTPNKTDYYSIEERMFRYVIRIFHYFNQMPVGILIMADTSNTFRPTQYRYTEPHTGLTTTYEFLLFKTADWRDRIDQIKESKDLVDQVVYVYLEFQQAQKQQWNKKKKRFTLKDMNHQKLEFKKRLFTHLVGLGMDQTEIRDVLLFIGEEISKVLEISSHNITVYFLTCLSITSKKMLFLCKALQN
jgi:hypothetical protein